MKKRIACVVVAPFVLGILAGTCLADPPEPCVNIPSLPCGSIPYLTGEQTWIPDPEEYDWTPNRLPAALISFRTGNYCNATSSGNYRGLQDWWYKYDDVAEYEGDMVAFTNLVARLNDAYDSGYRRIILNLPAGTVIGQDVSGSQWWGMPQWKRDAFTCLISDWLVEKPDTQFEVYSAFPVNEPDSLCMESNAFTELTEDGACGSGGEFMYYPCSGSGNAWPPSAFVQSDVCNFHTNIQPWQYLGITRVWLDYAYQHAGQFIEFPYCPLYAPGSGMPHFLGAEAFPMDFTDPYETALVMEYAIHCPAIMFPGHLADQDDDKTWDVSTSADVTELMVVVDSGMVGYFDSDADMDFDMFDVLAWTQRGFVLAAQSSANAVLPPQFTEYMKRVYDFGELANRADFNGDGAVNSADQSDFNAMYAIYQGKTGCNWVHGDLSGDNYVGAADVLYFNSWKLYHNSHPNDPVTADLGSADPMDALTKP